MSLLLGCRRRLVSLSAKLVPVHWQTHFGPRAAYMPLQFTSNGSVILGADTVKTPEKWRPRRRRILAAVVAFFIVLALSLGLGLGFGLNQVWMVMAALFAAGCSFDTRQLY